MDTHVSTTTIPTWSARPEPRPLPGAPGHYLLGTQLITTTIRQVCEAVYPEFAGKEPMPILRQTLCRFLQASHPGSPERSEAQRFLLKQARQPGKALINQMVACLIEPHIWGPYEVLAAPFTLALREPLAAGSADALVRIRATGDHALMVLEGTPKHLAAAQREPFLAHLGGYVAAAADTYRLQISHVIMVWCSYDGVRFEFISPDRCLEHWVTTADLYRWFQRNPLRGSS